MARIFLERPDSFDDIRRLFSRLTGDVARAGTTGECHPPCDVVERPGLVEVTVDLPGVPAESVTVVCTRDALLVAGQKAPAACGHDQATFHLAERTFGRFARIVRVHGAFDASQATASLRAGVLRIAIPKIDERRGKEIRIPVTAD